MTSPDQQRASLPDDLPDEETLLKELGLAMRAARKTAGLLQRELAHMTGYSRTSIANAEHGARGLSQDFYERVDGVLGTKLAHGREVVRVLRAERVRASMAADPDTGPDEFKERCEQIVNAITARVPDHAEIRADLVGAWCEAIRPPEQRLKIILEIHVLGEPG